MKSKLNIGIAVGLIITCVLLWGVYAQSSARAAAKVEWEYKVMLVPAGSAATEIMLNDLGKQGWELVAIQSFPAGGTTYIQSGPGQMGAASQETNIS